MENDIKPPLASFDSYLDSLGHQEDRAIDATHVADLDSVGCKLELSERRLKFKIDSLKAKGQLTPILQKQLDSLERNFKSLTKRYDSVQMRLQKLENNLAGKIKSPDTLKAIQGKLMEQKNAVNEVTTELGIGPLGSDLKTPQLSSSLPGNSALPQGPTLPSGTVPELPSLADRQIDPKVPQMPNLEG